MRAIVAHIKDDIFLVCIDVSARVLGKVVAVRTVFYSVDWQC